MCMYIYIYTLYVKLSDYINQININFRSYLVSHFFVSASQKISCGRAATVISTSSWQWKQQHAVDGQNPAPVGRSLSQYYHIISRVSQLPPVANWGRSLSSQKSYVCAYWCNVRRNNTKFCIANLG